MLLDPAAIGRTRDALRAAGFTAAGVHDLLGPTAHGALARGEPVPALRATRDGGPLSTLVRAFVLGAPVAADRLGAAVPLDAIGSLLERDGGEVRAVVDLRPYAVDEHDWWVFSDRTGPAGQVLRTDHVVGVGNASTTLARATPVAPVGSALDVGTGCGVQALHLSTHTGAVTATDVSARAVGFAATTLALNGVTAEIATGDLLEPVAGRRFDLVVSNPPFVVGSGARYSYRDSGLPGDEVCRRIIDAAPDHLTDGGTAVLLANWLHVRGQDWADRVAPWLAGTGCDAWLLQREVQDPAEYVGLWLRDAGEQDDPAAYDAWLDALEEQQVEAVGFGLVVLRRTGESPRVQVVEEARQPVDDPLGPELSGWLDRQAFLRRHTGDTLLAHAFRLAPSSYLETLSTPSGEGWTEVSNRVQLAAGLRWSAEVDDVGRALLAGCDGSTSLGSLLAVLEVVAGVDVAAALPAVRDLVSRGFLLP